MPDDAGFGLSRRQMLAAGGTGLLAATAARDVRPAARGRTELADGTPEQVHLTWGEDPARAVVVSWASTGQAVAPRVRIGQRIIAAAERAYTDGLNGEVTWTYHARVDGLRPGATYGYAVTADNDRSAADPFSATFTTAPEGRAAFRFTSFGDLATPNPRWASSYGQATYAVGAVETFQPLFHLLNGDLAYADLNPAAQPQVWRDFGNNIASSAAYRPWMPVPGNHELEFGNGEQGLASYLARYALPSNGLPAFEGRWYSFRVGTVAFVCLSGDDVAYQDAGAFVAGPAALVPDPASGNPPIDPGTSRYVRGYSSGAQTRWLEATLAAARRDASIDWIVAQLHQCACSSSIAGNGSDLGIRQEWLPLFDRYEVDLVLCGHDHGYERSFPVRGFDAPPDTYTGDTGAGSTEAGSTETGGTRAGDAGAGGTETGNAGAGSTEAGGAGAGGTGVGGTRTGDAEAGGIRAGGTEASGTRADGAGAGSAGTGDAEASGTRAGDAGTGGTGADSAEAGSTEAGGTGASGARTGNAEAGGIRAGGTEASGTRADGAGAGSADTRTPADAATSRGAGTCRPHPVTTVDSGVFDTSQGTVHLVLGCGGSNGRHDARTAADAYTVADAADSDRNDNDNDNDGVPLAKVFTRPNRPVPAPGGPPGSWLRPAADAVEAAIWSARRDDSAGYGIAVFDVDPGTEAGGQTSITVRYYHAAGADPAGQESPASPDGSASPGNSSPGLATSAPTGDYALFDTFTVVRPRSDGRRWHAR